MSLYPGDCHETQLLKKLGGKVVISDNFLYFWHFNLDPAIILPSLMVNTGVVVETIQTKYFFINHYSNTN